MLVSIKEVSLLEVQNKTNPDRKKKSFCEFPIKDLAYKECLQISSCFIEPYKKTKMAESCQNSPL